MILNILIYIYLLMFLILFFFKKKSCKAKIGLLGCLFIIIIELEFFFIYFVYHIVKIIVSEKSHVIKLYKIHGHVRRFGRLTWFANLKSLTFVFVF